MSNSIKYYQSANKVLKSLKYGKYLVVDVTSAEPSIYLERLIFLWRLPGTTRSSESQTSVDLPEESTSQRETKKNPKS